MRHPSLRGQGRSFNRAPTVFAAAVFTLSVMLATFSQVSGTGG